MEMNKNENKIGGGRIAYVDALKCIGILLVIKGHVDLFGFGVDSYDCMSSQLAYAFNMPIFFFISGYFAYKEIMPSNKILEGIRNKFVYLVLPAVFFSLYMNIVKERQLLGFIYKGFGIYWFTITLFYCFLLYYITRLFFGSRKCLCGILALISVIGVAYLSLGNKYEIPLLDLNHLSKYFQYFSFGIIAKMFNDKYVALITNKSLISIVTILLFCLLAIVCHCTTEIPSIVIRPLRDMVLRYAGTFIMLSIFFRTNDFFCKNNWLNKVILKIGRYSLPMYLLQYFFLPEFPQIENLDMFTINMISIMYTFLIVAVCMLFIAIISNSDFARKYILGQRK